MSKLVIPRKNSLLGVQRPRLEVEFADQMANWLAIERAFNNLASGAPPIFDFPGPVVISVTDLFPITSAVGFGTAYMTALSTGTATAGIWKNGVQQGSNLTMPAATTSTSVAFPITVAPGDYLQARVTAVGGGLQGFAIALG